MSTLTVEETPAALDHPLATLLRHNLWANQRLYTACLDLEEAQLAATDAGAYGTVQATLEHLVRSEQGYLRQLTQQVVGERWPRDKRPTPAEMLTLIELTGQALIDFTAQVQPGDTVVVQWNNTDWLMPVGTILTQAVNHATEHRTNVTTILKREGLPTLDLDGWSYYLAVQAQVAG